MNGVLGPILDVGVEGGSALGTATYSDDPAEVSAFADTVLRAYSDAGVFAAASHFPGLGSADQPTEEGPATVGLGLSELRRRDLLPFRAAVEDAVPGLVLSNALYPMNDFTAPASLSREVATTLLRGELGFQGVAITDDLSEPAVAVAASVPAGGGGGHPRGGGHALRVGTARRPGGGLRSRAAGGEQRSHRALPAWTRRWGGSWPRRRRLGLLR